MGPYPNEGSSGHSSQRLHHDVEQRFDQLHIARCEQPARHRRVDVAAWDVSDGL